jgi:hypothetical protein
MVEQIQVLSRDSDDKGCRLIYGVRQQYELLAYEPKLLCILLCLVHGISRFRIPNYLF